MAFPRIYDFCMVILICVQIDLFIPLSVTIVRSLLRHSASQRRAVRDHLDCGVVIGYSAWCHAGVVVSGIHNP
jgi:hypothetical protein